MAAVGVSPCGAMAGVAPAGRWPWLLGVVGRELCPPGAAVCSLLTA